MEQYLNLTDDLDSQPNLELELQSFFQLGLPPPQKQHGYSIRCSKDMAREVLAAPVFDEVQTPTSSPHFTYMTDAPLASEYELDADAAEVQAGAKPGASMDPMLMLNLNLHVGLNGAPFEGRRESVVSDTITPVASTISSPSPSGKNSSVTLAEAQHASMPSPERTPIKLLPRKNRRKSSSSSSCLSSSPGCSFHKGNCDRLSITNKRCVFKPAPRKKSELYLRPERRCPKFEFGVRAHDNVVDVAFHGGFIRNTIMDWYFESEALVPTSFQTVTIEYDHAFYSKMMEHIEPRLDTAAQTFRSYWKLIKSQQGPHIKLEFQPESLEAEVQFSNTQYFFNIVSRVVRPQSFGPIESGARYRSKMVTDMRDDDDSGQHRWCHFITSAEMKGILDFIFDGLDYIANDDTLPDKISKGIKPNPFKQHESRIRSHMVGYVSGKKCMKNATNVLSGERKVFSEEMYLQVIGYNDKKRPYNTLKEFAVMEVKYLMDNIEDLFEKFYWVDPRTVPEGGYKVRY